jgi:hypothetical protein
MSSFIRMFRIITGYTPTKFRSLYDSSLTIHSEDPESYEQLSG